MNPTTDRRPPRPSPARRSKIAASAISAGAMLAIVTGLTATAHDRQVTPGTSADSGASIPAVGTIQPPSRRWPLWSPLRFPHPGRHEPRLLLHTVCQKGPVAEMGPDAGCPPVFRDSDVHAETPSLRADRRPAMGGTAAITLVGGTAELLDECFRLLGDLEHAWSRFLEGSDVWRLNWSQGCPVRVRPCTARLVTELTRAWALTGGDFDPTTLPRLVASGYDISRVDASHRTTLPDTAVWPGAVAGIEIAGVDVRLPPGTTLDPGGLGKGLAADMVAELALDRGADGVLAEIGGDLVVAGQAPDNSGWTIGIEDPFTPGELLTVIRLTSGSVATSSRLVRVWAGADGPAHHLIDPVTGASAATSTVTSTVIAGSGARAEALAKLAFLREPDPLLSWLPRIGAAGLIVSADRRQRCSPNWQVFA